MDSGAEVNVLSEVDWNNLEADFVAGNAFIYDVEHKSKKRILAYASAEPLQILASFRGWIEVPGFPTTRVFAKFFVIKHGQRSLLSRTTAKRMKVLHIGLQLNEVTLERMGEASKPFPKIPNELVEFDVDETVPFTKNAYYNVPAAYSKPAAELLEDMEKQDIIEKVIKAPRSIAGMSAVPKGLHK